MPRERVSDDVYRAWVDACDVWSYAAAARLAGLSLHAFRNVGTAWGVRPNARTCDAVLKLGEIARRLKEIRDELEWALEMYQAGFWPEGLRHDGNP